MKKEENHKFEFVNLKCFINVYKSKDIFTIRSFYIKTF